MNLPQMSIPKPYFVNQLPFLTNNWRAFQISDNHDYSKFIRIRDSIATITNGQALVRSLVTEVPDGFYMMGDDGGLYDAQMELANTWSGYRRDRFPDVDAIKPDFNAMTMAGPIPAGEVRQMVDFLSYVKVDDGNDQFRDARVLFDGAGLYSTHKSDLWFSLSFCAPVNADNGRFHANTLRLVLIDMLRYPHIFIGRDNRGMLEDPPLFIGRNWDSCGLIKSM